VTLLSQTAWVNDHGVFRLHVAAGAIDPSVDTLDILVYHQLHTRIDFDSALQGKYNSYSWYYRYLPVDNLVSDPSGVGFDVDIPVNQASTGNQEPTLVAQAGSAIFPIDVSVRDSKGNVEGQSFTTFLVWAAGPPAVTSYPRLDVSVVVPVSTTPTVTASASVGGISAADSTRLSVLGNALSANPTVPVTIAAAPRTLDSLLASRAQDRETLASLAEAVARGSEALPSTYSGQSVGSLVEAGLSDEADRQVAAGLATISGILGNPVTSSTWLTLGATSPANVAGLLDRQMTGLIAPDADLSSLPTSVTYTTFALPTGLDFPGAQGVTAMAIDPGITADFTRQTNNVLNANQILAELAMIQMESPGIQRGIVVAPPAGWSPPSQIYSTLLAGLAGNPLLQPVTARNLLAQVPHANLTRQITSSDPNPAGDAQLTNDASLVRQARSQLSAIDSMTPVAAAQVSKLEKRLFVAESPGLGEADRQVLLESIALAAQSVTHGISLPSSSSITLTSPHSSIPLTVLSNPVLHAHVRLTLISQRLIFQPFTPPNGSCVIISTSTESCQLVLAAENTTIKVPVQTRASGVFPLDVTLSSADGSLTIAHNQDTVTSTAISGVGIVLISLAVVSLAVWWIRDLRRGRRSRTLVPSPVAEGPATDEPEELLQDH
jgi:hypothetical protein